MNSFEEKAINKELNKEGLIKTKLINTRNHNNQPSHTLYIILEYKKSIYTTYIGWDRLYKDVRPQRYTETVKSAINNMKQWLDSIDKLTQDKTINNKMKAYKISLLVENQLGNLSKISSKGFDVRKFRRKNKIKIEKLVQKDISPIQMINKFRNEYALHRVNDGI